ncbi:MAG: hypothetical protein ABI999_11485 [Acidobacteriota bacterium]
MLFVLACVSLVSFGCRIPTRLSIENAGRKKEAQAAEPKVILSYVHLATGTDNLPHVTGNVANPTANEAVGVRIVVTYPKKDGRHDSGSSSDGRQWAGLNKNTLASRDDFQEIGKRKTYIEISEIPVVKRKMERR